MAVDADRRHGRGFSSGTPRGAVRSIGARCRERAACASGIAIPLLRLLFQLAKLDELLGCLRRLIRLRSAAAAAGHARSRAVSLLPAYCNRASSAPHLGVW